MANGFNIKIGSILDTSGAEKSIGKLTKSIQTAVKTSSGELLTKQMNTYVKSVELADGTVRKYTKTFTSLLNAQGQYVDIKGRVLKQQGEELVKQEQTTKAVKTTTQAIKANTDALQAQGNAASKTSNVFRDFGESLAKMAYFKIANEALSLFTTACNEATQAIFDYNAAMTELKKVTSFSEEEYTRLASDLDEISGKVARTRTELTESVTEFGKSGTYTTKELESLAYAATLYQNVADSELSAGDAASYIISQMKAYGIAAEDAMTIIDKTNEVSNNFAVSSTDISTALTKGASALAGYGNTIDETIGLVTAGSEIMTDQASKVVKGIRTIGANILNAAQSADTLEISVNGVTKSVALLDETTGDMRSTYDVLKDIAKEWDNMTNAEKSSLALSLSGKTQIDVFTSVLSNFDSAINAVETSLGAAGSAEKENEKYLKSLQASVQAIKQEFTKLILGDGGLEKFAKMLLDSATAVLKFINAIGGMNTILTTLGVATLITVIYNFDKLQKAVKSGLALFQTFGNYINNTLNNYLNAYINSTIVFADAEEAAAAAAELEAAGIEMVKLSLSALVAILGLVFIAYQKYKQAQEQARQEAISTAEEYEEQAKKFDEQLAKIKDEATTRAELCEVIKNQLGDAYDQEKEDLKDINELRQEAIEKLYEEAQAKAKETQRELGGQYDAAKAAMKETDTFTARAGGYGTGHAHGTSGTTVTVEGTDAARYAKIGVILDEYNKKRQQGIELSKQELEVEKQLTEEYNRLKDKIDANKSVIDAYEEAAKTLSKTLKEWVNSAQDTNDETGNLNDALSELGYNYNELEEALSANGGSIDTFNDLLNESTDSAVTYAQGILGVGESSESLTDAIDSQIASMESLAESYTTLQAIADEYNSTGQLSLETIRQLNQLTAEQVAALEFHNGVASVNVDLLKQQYEIEKQEAINKLQLAKQIAIVALEEQYLNQEAEATGSQLETQQIINENTAATYDDIYTAASKAAAGVARVRAELGADSDEYKQFLKDRKSIIDEYDAMIDSLKNSELELADTSKKAAKSSSKSHSSAAKKTEDAWKKAFDEEKKALDHMHEMNEISDEEYYNRLLELNEKYFGEASGQHEKYLDEYRKNEETAFKGLQKVYKDRLKKQTDAQLKALKQQKDAALKAIDAEIKGVKKAKDAALKAIDERIKAIKKQKDEAIKAVEAEIKALNKQKEAQHKYFQDRIDALQRAHDLQEQINQLEEYENQLAQAKAQRVWVMKDGQFQLGENEEAVNTAEQQLSDYKDDLDYERQLQELQDLQAYWDEYYDNLIEKKEEYKDYIEEYYDQQIEALEEYRDRVEEEYDAQIEALEEYRDQVEEMYDNMIEAYKEHVDAMLEAFDKFNEGNKEKYGTAIDDLRAFVAEWNGLIASMASIDGAMSGVTNFMSSGGMVSLKHHSGGAAEIGSYASGNGSSVKDDEIALVGESPNTEMLIGSKVNTGVVARLHKGSGVVNAESTKTLAGILNKLGKNKYIGNSSTEGGVTQNFTFGSISLPNVTDANSFVEALRTTFGSYSVQYANAKA